MVLLLALTLTAPLTSGGLLADRAGSTAARLVPAALIQEMDLAQVQAERAEVKGRTHFFAGPIIVLSLGTIAFPVGLVLAQYALVVEGAGLASAILLFIAGPVTLIAGLVWLGLVIAQTVYDARRLHELDARINALQLTPAPATSSPAVEPSWLLARW